MKITSSVSVLLALIPFARARLKAATTVLQLEDDMNNELGGKKKETGWHKPLRLTYQMMHYSTEDIDPDGFNKKLAAGAFNRAFEQVFDGVTSDWGFFEDSVDIPEPMDPGLLGDTRNGRYYFIRYGNYAFDARCRLCPEDLLSRGNKGGESFSNFLKDQEKWDEVSKLFCTELKGTGVENFKEIDNCQFTVGYLGENEAEMMEYTASVALESRTEALMDASGSMKSIISVHRLHPSAVVDVELLESAFATAYNNLFEDRGYSVEGIQLLRQITAPESALGQNIVRVHGNKVAISVWDEEDGDNEDGDDDDDDSEDIEFQTAMFWVNVQWSCKGKKCGADGMLPGVFLQNMPETSRHNLLESYLCNNLREFGGAAYADAAGCDIMFQP